MGQNSKIFRITDCQITAFSKVFTFECQNINNIGDSFLNLISADIWHDHKAPSCFPTVVQSKSLFHFIFRIKRKIPFQILWEITFFLHENTQLKQKNTKKKKQMERYVKWEYLKLKMAFIYLTRYDASMAFMKTNDKSLFLRKHEAELMCLFWLFHFSVSFCIQLKSINKNCF